MILNVFVCNALLQNAHTNHQTYDRKTDENGPKIVPKPLQNRSWRGSGGHLGATLETRCFQDFIFDDFGSILGPSLGPVWGNFGHHFFDVFLRWLFDGFGLHLGSVLGPPLGPVWGHFGHHFFDVFLKGLFDGLGLHLDPQNTSKMRPNRGSKSRPENHRFCYYLLHFSHI